MGSQITIGQITRFPLKFIITTITRVAGVATLHLNTQNYMHVGVECLRNVIFDWCAEILVNMKHQLIKCKKGKNNNFGYGRILTILFFERVPCFRSRENLPFVDCHKPRLVRWSEVFVR